MDLSAYHSFIQELARESAAVILPHYGRPELAVEIKADDSPVTVADRGAEQRMRELINAKFPAHGIIGEEFGSERADAEWTWVLDPIDGTKSFISGVPLWGTLIGLLHRGQPVLGCIHQPVLKQLMIGDGKVTTLNGQPVRVRATTRLGHATVLTSDTRNLARYQNGAASERLVSQARIYRTWADCYGYLLLASGFADISMDPIMNPWDIAALVPVVRGAGGVITDWHGGPAYPAESTLAAATPELHAEAIQILNSI
ncbi:histidinol-phosphatase [Oleiharenicola lentus]|uniref:histidinol-phosphatase n=1 Tax=Oleiharenicola lentus TaxID=2508720 RepID=UPI003F67F56F